MFRPDDRIGPYTLVRIIGRGAFGEVWLAEKRSSLLTTQVALKMPMVAENEVEMVRQEAALWLQASGHPNIVPVLDAEVYGGQVIIASEFVAGGSLHEWMTQRVPPNGGKAGSLEEAVSITNAILAGLDYLHRSGLTHRDLKPENVLLQDGIPRLTDFGLARVLKTEAQTGTVSGTPRYMAPETFSGSYSESADLWAIGVMLYELLTGTHPFPTQELMALIAAIQSQEPTPLPETIPRRLRNIVDRLLAKSPGDRYATASAVREALQNCLVAPSPVPVDAAEASALPPNNLPVQPTSFIGREKQIAELKGMLEHTHLLTLTGSGGCGKTRLSLQVAEEVLARFPDGVWLVELAPLTDPTLVTQTVANALGIREQPGTPLMQILLEALKPKTLLLLLDNCEHLLDVVVRLVDTVLRSCPGIKFLASSREGLGIAGETVYRIPSLSLPDLRLAVSPETMSQYEAVHLFVDRAAAALPAFAITRENASAVAQVCLRLDGIPLAIELAAVRVRSLPVEQIEARLHDRFRLLTGGSRTALPRQQTLRALVQWSFDLLNNQEKTVLCRLSVFAGGWYLEAAEKVCSGEEIEAWEILDLLTALVDKSLVVYEEQQGEARYRLLETVRQYARERLAEKREVEAVRERHQAHFLAFAEEAEPQLVGREQGVWLDRLERDHDNLRAAMEWTNKAALRVAGALVRFWQIRGYLSEGRQWLAGVLAATDVRPPDPARAKALRGAGTLAHFQGDSADAQLKIQEGLALYRELGDRLGIAYSLIGLGGAAHIQGNKAEARRIYEESLAVLRELGDKRGIAYVLNNLGDVDFTQGNYASARAFHEEGLALIRELDDKQGIARSLNNLGAVAFCQGDYAAASALHKESLTLVRELGNKTGMAFALHGLALIAHYQGDNVTAERLHRESLAVQRDLGSKQGIAYSLLGLGDVALTQGDAAAARTLYEECLAILRPLGDIRGIGYALLGMGNVAQNQCDNAAARKVYRESLTLLRRTGDIMGAAASLEACASLAHAQKQSGRAVLLWGAAEGLREAAGSPRSKHDYLQYEREVALARAALDEVAFTAAWAEGRAMTMEQAIEYALADELAEGHG